jgi:hypothetical protein
VFLEVSFVAANQVVFLKNKQEATVLKYSTFNNDGSEYVVTNPGTPRAFDNFLCNNSIF